MLRSRGHTAIRRETQQQPQCPLEHWTTADAKTRAMQRLAAAAQRSVETCCAQQLTGCVP
eukprot:366329-Chlamydomonas_euryale.AAC.5